MSADRIAIVGLACRYPDAATPAQLWQNVLATRQAFRRLPDCRLGLGYRDDAPDGTYLTRAAVLRDWTFDRERFGVPGPLYRAADHTHWLALETAAAALADAGVTDGDGLDRDTTGVVLGNSLTGEFSRAGLLRLRWPFLADAAATALAEAGLADDVAADVLTRLETQVKEPFPLPGDETLSGALANTIAGRVCNYFDFHGTGYTIDGACSSSLLAVAAACRALVAGECDFMLAGGVDLSLDPLELVGFSRLGALATTDMRVYDANPTGFLPGEGCGVVALMRAVDAEARGLRAYAHIIGWASSSDGSGGLTQPELSGQALALHRAYHAAGIAPEKARLVEGHGTGTPIGDRVELSALSSVRGSNAPPGALGSIKANIGHTKAAAGAASLIKATLATHHRMLPPTTDAARPATPTGVRGWVRQFEPVWLPFETPSATPGPDDTLTVTLPDDASPADVVVVLAEITERRPRRLRIVHTGHPAAQGVGRSIAAEFPDCQVVVLERLDTTDPGDAGLGHPDRYLELRTRLDGTLERAALRARPPRPRQHADATPLLPEGVCLVTGGIRGITAHAAAELAAGTDTTLLFLGRTPADDSDVTAALQGLTASGQTDVHYLRCDVTDSASVQATLTEVRIHGAVTGIIHGAGLNEPRPLDDVTAESFAATLAPKVNGLRTLLDALGDADDLRLLMAFGSIIGRQGLAGQAEYCIANDWLRADVEAWAGTHPHCRTHLLEWSVWSGVGMGVRLGVLDNLRRQGVEPIGTREGVDALRDVLADPQAPVTVLITARFPDTATLHLAADPAPLLRFGEHVRTRIPGVEAVTEAELSLGSDPYLDDHRIDGTPVLPAVIAMEAVAQATSHVDTTTSLPMSMTHLKFRAPITLTGPDPRTIQIAALTDAHGTDVIIRDDADRVSGTLIAAPEPPAPQRTGQQPPPSRDAGPHECYETTFFHTGRFRRLLSYELLSAFRVRAWIRAEEGSEVVPWFSPFHSGRLLLGDPGAHDATLHVLLACVPHRRALPVGVERITVWREPTGVLRVDAAEVSHTADDYVFDVVLSEPDGTIVAHWQGLRLHATTPPQRKGTLPVQLVGPWLSRRLVECGLHDHVELLTAPGRRTFGAATGLLQQLTGASTGHDLAGAPRLDGSHASASYAHNTLLLGVSDDPVGVDWESVPATPAHAGAVPCDAADHPVAELLADKLGEDPTLARLRVWTAREALSKLGYGQGEPLRIDRITEDGLTIVRTGAHHVATAKIHTTDSRGAQVKVAAVACPKEPRT
ncbi:MAG: SDR family NAD(P)-dependent oxidoreductase [Actinophytocola sp.]|nr:SDR family NAD(P)-dependent oxidoreductase [Actinophytocola sp.]